MKTQRTADDTVAALTLHRRVAANVRAEMARYNVTQVRAAEVLGLAQQAVSARLRGATPFTLNELERLAPVLHTTPAGLLTGHNEGPRPDGGPDGGLDIDLVRHQGLEPRTRWLGVVGTQRRPNGVPVSSPVRRPSLPKVA